MLCCRGALVPQCSGLPGNPNRASPQPGGGEGGHNLIVFPSYWKLYKAK